MLNKHIIDRYSELFDLDSAPWNSSMQWGIQVTNPVWLEIIERLLGRLRPLAAIAISHGYEFRILSIKEKFGTLRITYREATDQLEAEIERAKQETLTASYI